ncbi:MAG TPA: zinc ribbon domain-containing protein [Caldisericia bacterium]|nr:zinc ribbon domain-containing protein [Caldisericia bacterium]HPF48513.1 zinc ribbon domain-containing protein [Caldisericia bacterium]HPI83306.1 zinc ribbon domain-containing protein [Caldisericia bacterium]HPQ92968.1 zinc ribbon domain-containing protein [Caldisericia bacterium]HRV75198.1 zinc ribbon domain-containing protein [Caldisericia bacterium]
MDKVCISCGMPMRNAEDFPNGDTTKDYCVYCARPDGTMKSWDEAVEGMTGFLVSSQGLDKEVAKEMAEKNLAKLPAWKDRK